MDNKSSTKTRWWQGTVLPRLQQEYVAPISFENQEKLPSCRWLLQGLRGHHVSIDGKKGTAVATIKLNNTERRE
jgi:hypothetical protein